MADTNYTDNIGPAIVAAWLNDINNWTYRASLPAPQNVPATVASAATIDIGAVRNLAINITGTTTITSFGASYTGPRFLTFAGSLTLTNSAALSLPGGVNIVTSAGDYCLAYPNSTSTGWNVLEYIVKTAVPGGNGTVANGCIYENNTTIASNYTLSAGKNGSCVGPLTINSGVTLTIPSGQRLIVL